MCLVILAALLGPAIYGQNRERFGISAKAGGVNAVTGVVLLKRTNDTSARDLSEKDDLESGDLVTTDTNSQVEVLLNPGSYLRVAANSEFMLADNSLDHLVIQLSRGSAIIEATGESDRVGYQIGVDTPRSRFKIITGGIYRFDVSANSTDLSVYKGKVLVAGQVKPVKSGNKLSFSGNEYVTAKLNKKDRDQFDLWSKDRGEFLAQANRKLTTKVLNTYLASSRLDSAFQWDIIRNRFGLWAYSPFARCYTFFPFWWGWVSPYGGVYGRNGWVTPDYNRGNLIVANPNNAPWYGGYGNPTNGNTGGTTIPGNGSRGTGTMGATGMTGVTGPSSSPVVTRPSQAGPRDPDSGGRSINRIKDPIK